MSLCHQTLTHKLAPDLTPRWPKTTATKSISSQQQWSFSIRHTHKHISFCLLSLTLELTKSLLLHLLLSLYHFRNYADLYITTCTGSCLLFCMMCVFFVLHACDKDNFLFHAHLMDNKVVNNKLVNTDRGKQKHIL